MIYTPEEVARLLAERPHQPHYIEAMIRKCIKHAGQPQEREGSDAGAVAEREQAPPNSLPSWAECQLIIENHAFRERAKAGREGAVLDTPPTTPEPTELHRFIYEYDDADSYRSAWFLHRLERLLQATRPQPASDASGGREVDLQIAALRRDAEQSRGGLAYLGKVADTIATLSRALAESRDDGGWISVGERLPDDGTECLVVVQYGTDPKTYIAIDTWRMQREAPVSFSSATIETGLMWDDHDFLDVLCWRALPAKPDAETIAAFVAAQQQEGK